MLDLLDNIISPTKPSTLGSADFQKSQVSEILSRISAVWYDLIHVKHYKFIPRSEVVKLAEKKDSAQVKLVTKKANAKTADQLAYDEYTRQLELAIENH